MNLKDSQPSVDEGIIFHMCRCPVEILSDIFCHTLPASSLPLSWVLSSGSRRASIDPFPLYGPKLPLNYSMDPSARSQHRIYLPSLLEQSPTHYLSVYCLSLFDVASGYPAYSLLATQCEQAVCNASSTAIEGSSQVRWRLYLF